MNKLFFTILSVFFLYCPIFLPKNVFAETFQNVGYDVCFTPGEDCTQLIIDTIKKSKKNLKIQAYSFTSAPIAQAVIDVQKQGVDVQVILDKSQFTSAYSASTFLLNHRVKVWKDHRVAIAHNKVMIIDDETLITGSFNFTQSAQKRNAENVLIIKDKKIANKYVKNWQKRMAFSDLIEPVDNVSPRGLTARSSRY